MYGRTSWISFGDVTTPERSCWLTTVLAGTAVLFCSVAVVS